MIIFDLSIASRADVLYDFIKPGIPSFFPPKYLTTIIKVFVKSLVSIVSFFNQKNLLTHETKNKLVNDGVFYHKLFISSEGCGFTYDFDNKKVCLNNFASKKYFNFTTHNLSGGVYQNKYENSDNVAQCCVNFQHSLYGSMTIDLNYFSNPQIKYGIGMKLPNNTQDLSGLLIREYFTSSMKVSSLSDESEKHGVLGENEKITVIINA